MESKSLGQGVLLVGVDAHDKMDHHLLDLCSFLLLALYLSKPKYLCEQGTHLGGNTALGILNCQKWTGNQEKVSARILLE